MNVSNEWDLLASQKSFRLLGEMESQRRQVTAVDLEKNKTPSKSLGSGLWRFLKIIPLRCKEYVRGLVCSLSMTTTKKIRQCISLLKGCNLHIFVCYFGYYPDSETNLMCKCGCVHTQNAFHIGDTCSCALPGSDYMFLRFVWVGSSVSMLQWVYIFFVQCVPRSSN